MEHWLYRALHGVFALLTGLLFVSGTYLVFFYQPTAAQAWSDIYDLQEGGRIEFGLFVRRLHSWTTIVWIASLIPFVLFEAMRNSGRVALLLGVAFIGGVAAMLSGLFLPWDQLALWSVTVGTDMIGYTPIFGDDVRFVLVNGQEVAVSTIRRALIIHVIVGSAVTLLVVAASITALRHSTKRAAHA